MRNRFTRKVNKQTNKKRGIKLIDFIDVFMYAVFMVVLTVAMYIAMGDQKIMFYLFLFSILIAILLIVNFPSSEQYLDEEDQTVQFYSKVLPSVLKIVFGLWIWLLISGKDIYIVKEAGIYKDGIWLRGRGATIEAIIIHNENNNREYIKINSLDVDHDLETHIVRYINIDPPTYPVGSLPDKFYLLLKGGSDYKYQVFVFDSGEKKGVPLAKWEESTTYKDVFHYKVLEIVGSLEEGTSINTIKADLYKEEEQRVKYE